MSPKLKFPNPNLDFRDLTNDALSRDREACKQHAFKLFSATGGTLQPKEGKTVTIWLQAPFKKGQTTLKLLFYYGTPQHYPKLRYKFAFFEIISNNYLHYLFSTIFLTLFFSLFRLQVSIGSSHLES